MYHSQSFSRPQPLSLQAPNNENNKITDTVQPKLFCYCKRGEDEDNMIGCDNENCEIEWFHFFCVGMKAAPKGQWYCPECRQLPKFRRTGKVRPKGKNP